MMESSKTKTQTTISVWQEVTVMMAWMNAGGAKAVTQAQISQKQKQQEQ